MENINYFILTSTNIKGVNKDLFSTKFSNERLLKIGKLYILQVLIKMKDLFRYTLQGLVILKAKIITKNFMITIEL